jgi:hypothetical protein
MITKPPTRTPGAATPLLTEGRGRARRLLLSTAGFLVAVPLVAQEASAPAAATQAVSAAAPAGPRLLRASTGAAIRVDGRLDEPAWAEASVAEGFVQRRPDPGAPSNLQTQVRVLFGEGVLYVAARMADSPDSIAAQLARRDATGTYSDWFSVMLDSDLDRRSAFTFSVSPRGVRRDGITTETGRTELTWDAVWEARTAVDSLGWTAELAIPLSQLRFSPGQTTWGVNFAREVARRDELSYWVALLPNQPGFVSRFGGLEGVEGVGSAARLELEPYTVSRVTRAPGNGRNPFYSSNDVFASAGLDLRYRLTSNLTLTGTINPDFGQVEADPAVVNLSAFETFLPERRPFFVQGSDIFDFRIGSEFDTEMLFYSRRIGRVPLGSAPRGASFVDQPDLTTILGAAKVSGKTSGGWSVGILDVVTAPEYARFTMPSGIQDRARVEPTTHYGVARISKDFRSGRSAIGTLFTTTNRLLEPRDSLDFLRSDALVAGLDGRHRFGGNRYEVTGWTVGSYVRGSARAIAATQQHASRYFQRPDASHVEFDADRTSLGGYASDLQVAKIAGNWTWKLRGSTRSPGFEINDLGYQRQADRITQAGELRYARYKPAGAFRSWSVTGNQALEWTFGGEQVQQLASANSAFQLSNFWSGFAMVQRGSSVLNVANLRGGPALHMPGYTGGVLMLNSDLRKPVSANLFANLYRTDGEGAGGSATLNPSLSVRPSPRWNLSVGPSLSWNTDRAQYVDQRRVAGETRYFAGRLRQTTTSLTARLNYTFSPALSFQFYAQPFVSAGSYDRFQVVEDSRAPAFGDRFAALQDGAVLRDAAAGRYQVDVDGDGDFDTTIRDAAFNTKQLRSNAVLRWEYRPGSALFVVWNQGRSDFRPDGSFDLDRDVNRLFGARGSNTLLVKLSYWFNP